MEKDSYYHNFNFISQIHKTPSKHILHWGVFPNVIAAFSNNFFLQNCKKAKSNKPATSCVTEKISLDHLFDSLFYVLSVNLVETQH